MPDLPTITVTQAQADRILLAFGGTQATAVPAYRVWLKEQVRNKVILEAALAQTALNEASSQAAVNTTAAELP